MSQMTLYRAIAAGEFPAVRIGRRLVVPARVLEDMAAAALATGTTVDTADWPTAVRREAAEHPRGGVDAPGRAGRHGGAAGRDPRP